MKNFFLFFILSVLCVVPLIAFCSPTVSALDLYVDEQEIVDTANVEIENTRTPRYNRVAQENFESYMVSSTPNINGHYVGQDMTDFGTTTASGNQIYLLNDTIQNTLVTHPAMLCREGTTTFLADMFDTTPSHDGIEVNLAFIFEENEKLDYVQLRMYNTSVGITPLNCWTKIYGNGTVSTYYQSKGIILNTPNVYVLDSLDTDYFTRAVILRTKLAWVTNTYAWQTSAFVDYSGHNTFSGGINIDTPTNVMFEITVYVRVAYAHTIAIMAMDSNRLCNFGGPVDGLYTGITTDATFTSLRLLEGYEDNGKSYSSFLPTESPYQFSADSSSANEGFQYNTSTFGVYGKDLFSNTTLGYRQSGAYYLHKTSTTTSATMPMFAVNSSVSGTSVGVHFISTFNNGENSHVCNLTLGQYSVALGWFDSDEVILLTNFGGHEVGTIITLESLTVGFAVFGLYIIQGYDKMYAGLTVNGWETYLYASMFPAVPQDVLPTPTFTVSSFSYEGVWYDTEYTVIFLGFSDGDMVSNGIVGCEQLRYALDGNVISNRFVATYAFSFQPSYRVLVLNKYILRTMGYTQSDFSTTDAIYLINSLSVDIELGGTNYTFYLPITSTESNNVFGDITTQLPPTPSLFPLNITMNMDNTLVSETELNFTYTIRAFLRVDIYYESVGENPDLMAVAINMLTPLAILFVVPIPFVAYGKKGGVMGFGVAVTILTIANMVDLFTSIVLYVITGLMAIIVFRSDLNGDVTEE